MEQNAAQMKGCGPRQMDPISVRAHQGAASILFEVPVPSSSTKGMSQMGPQEYTHVQYLMQRVLFKLCLLEFIEELKVGDYLACT